MISYNKVAARVLARLKVMYPQFASQILNDPEMASLAIDEWSKGLNGIPMERIEQGLEMVRQSKSAFAPSLPQFINFCGGRVLPWWQSWKGIEQRGKELGVPENHRKDLYRLEVIKQARATGEEVLISKTENQKEHTVFLPGTLKNLTNKMKTNL